MNGTCFTGIRIKVLAHNNKVEIEMKIKIDERVTPLSYANLTRRNTDVDESMAPFIKVIIKERYFGNKLATGMLVTTRNTPPQGMRHVAGYNNSDESGVDIARRMVPSVKNKIPIHLVMNVPFISSMNPLGRPERNAVSEAKVNTLIRLSSCVLQFTNPTESVIFVMAVVLTQDEAK